MGDERGPIDDLMPTDPLMIGPWAGCLSWALGNEEIMARFRAETGNVWRPSVSQIEQMIDKATGVELIFIRQFVQWVNVNFWGDLDLPAFSEKRERI